MASSVKVRTSVACQIADVDHQRFNETIAKSFYPCVPPTARGSTRLFDLDDIVALTVYGGFLKQGTIPRNAGPVACQLRDLLRQHPDLVRAYYFRDSHGGGKWSDIPGQFVDHDFSVEILNVAAFRKRVAERLAELGKTLDESDE